MPKTEFLKLMPASGSPDTGYVNAKRQQEIVSRGDVLGLVLYDKLPVSQEKREELKRVDERGTIFVLPAGEIEVAGLGLFDVEARIKEKLSAYVVSPHCEVTITKKAYEPSVYIFGEVGKSGSLPLKQGDRLLDALSAAGGCKADAYSRSIKLIRIDADNITMTDVNLQDLFSKGNVGLNVLLRDQDVVFVPRRLFTNFQEVMSVLGAMLPWYYFVSNFK